jgi:glyoxylase-like metal-dependent hydrolase (beta-lactamase superfamily II)
VASPVRDIDVRHLGNERVICSFRVDDVLVDPGPESSVEHLLEALGDDRPAKILLTHIHFDHAGATGALVRRWPDVEVWVHERGARHIVDPERLVTSATRLYGDDMKRLWGEVVPVPEANVRVLEGGERIGPWRVEYTPGHAQHHVSYLHEDHGIAFVGDTGGVRITPETLVVPPTPPPDIDLDAWRRSVDVIEGWQATELAVTHFGRHDDVAEHLDRLREGLDRWGELARAGDEAAYTAAVREAYGATGDPGAYEQASPAETLYPGLARYWAKLAAG